MAYNTAIETFRDKEYPMMKGKVYLDHGGTTLYAKSLIDSFAAQMLSNLYGNPHSNSDPAELSSHVVEATRQAALRFFGADPEHFDLIFTANATAAIKLVGESFRDLALEGSRTGTFFYGYHRDAHTSLVGVRELTAGSHHCFVNDAAVEKWLNGDSEQPVLNTAGVPGLFAYPGQSNMTGRRLPLSWTRRLRQSNKAYHQDMYSLLDAAALATTCQLDFSDPDAAPDFTALSFYKIFGFPDLGALIVRKKSGHILSWRRYFGGGTVSMLTVLRRATVQRKDNTLHEALEDGTLPFHSIVALNCAIDVHKKLYGTMRAISQHTLYLARRLYDGLSSLRHYNDRPVCVLHTESDRGTFSDSTKQGATLSISVVDADGRYIEHSLVETLANEQGIYVRSGGLCNPGGIAHHLHIEPWQFQRAWSSGYRCGGEDNHAEIIHGKPTGVVRASLGAMSTIADVDAFVTFMAENFATKATYDEADRIELAEVSMNGVKEYELQECKLLVRTDSGFGSGGSTSGSCPPERRHRTDVVDTFHPRQDQEVRALHDSKVVYSGKSTSSPTDPGVSGTEYRWLSPEPNLRLRRFSLEEHRITPGKARGGLPFGSEGDDKAGDALRTARKGRFKFWAVRKTGDALPLSLKT